MRHAVIRIRKSALQHNLQRVRHLAPNSKVISMVKANAYGIGVQHAVEAFSNTDAFGVASLAEALEIRTLGNDKPITLIEGVFEAEEMSIAIQQKFECVIHHQQQLDWLLEHKDNYKNAGLKVWVKLNSGMNRLGFKADQIIEVIQHLKNEGFHCVLAMHFANADVPDHPMNQVQIEQLLSIKQACAPIEVSCCNSAAIYNWADLHFDYVRPGIMLYGASPFFDRTASSLGIEVVMQFEAQIIAINPIKTGEHVGYGSSFTSDRDMTIAVVSIGYGDGYPRSLFAQNFIAIAGQKVPVVGRVSMDMITVDVSSIKNQVKLGDTVELWGDTQSIDEVAQCNQSIGYELLCRLTKRPQVIVED